jgi:hypothetical protein
MRKFFGYTMGAIVVALGIVALALIILPDIPDDEVVENPSDQAVIPYLPPEKLTREGVRQLLQTYLENTEADRVRSDQEPLRLTQVREDIRLEVADKLKPEYRDLCKTSLTPMGYGAGYCGFVSATQVVSAITGMRQVWGDHGEDMLVVNYEMRQEPTEMAKASCANITTTYHQRAGIFAALLVKYDTGWRRGVRAGLRDLSSNSRRPMWRTSNGAVYRFCGSHG